jgi:hypothetical protein
LAVVRRLTDRSVVRLKRAEWQALCIGRCAKSRDAARLIAVKTLLILFLALGAACRAGITDEPVDDQRLQSALLKFGESQIDSGKATKASEIRAQFDRQRCRVALEPISEKAGAFPDGAARIRPGVAVVGGLFKCKKCAHWHIEAASGFFISSDGVVVTNHHVVAGAEKEAFVVLSGDGRMGAVTELLATDPVADVAILRCEGSGFTALPLNAEARDGSPVGVWSHPSNRFFSLSAGIVARRFMLRKDRKRIETLAITADYARGSSGGPVFDERGNVVGMVSSTESVYYNEKDGQQQNLQMVFKNCVSARSILALIDRPSAD